MTDKELPRFRYGLYGIGQSVGLQNEGEHDYGWIIHVWRREFVGPVTVQPLRKPAIGWANQRS